MSLALCIRCGAEKFGAFESCRKCQFAPATEGDLVQSMALTDRYHEESVLAEIGAEMRAGMPRPKLPPDQEKRFLATLREPRYRALVEGMLADNSGVEVVSAKEQAARPFLSRRPFHRDKGGGELT